MNVYDSTRMVDSLANEGYAETANISEADLVVLNTCHIREKASEKVFSELGRLKELKSERASRGDSMVLAVAGCVAQAEGKEIVRRQPAVDIVIGTQSYHRFSEALGALRLQSHVVLNEFAGEDKFDALPKARDEKISSRGVSAFVTIQEGCDKFCAFCVVPFTRGVEYSRPVGKILDEVEQLARCGVREVTLLGQNVNAYHGIDVGNNEVSLATLIEKVALIQNIERIRYTTSHPNDMRQDLIEAHRDIPKLMPYLHLPAQSGSDRILKAMNRKHSAQDYFRTIERMRGARADIAISSDFIVGFPGETRVDFDATLKFIRAVGFSSAYSFKYSIRPGTSAAVIANQIDPIEQIERLAELQELLEAQRHSFNAAFLNKCVDVLFEKPGRYKNQVIGKTPYMQAVFAEGTQDCIGTVRSVTVEELRPNAFRGRITDDGGQ